MDITNRRTKVNVWMSENVSDPGKVKKEENIK